jgi:hypothetical protein
MCWPVENIGLLNKFWNDHMLTVGVRLDICQHGPTMTELKIVDASGVHKY